MERLHGRDCVNKKKVADKINEIIDVLEEKGIIEEEEGEKKNFPEV